MAGAVGNRAARPGEGDVGGASRAEAASRRGRKRGRGRGRGRGRNGSRRGPPRRGARVDRGGVSTLDGVSPVARAGAGGDDRGEPRPAHALLVHSQRPGVGARGQQGQRALLAGASKAEPSRPRAVESTLPRTSRGSPAPSFPRAARPPTLCIPPDDSRTLPSFLTRRAA